MFTSSVLARAKAALQGTETEQRIAVLLYDDAVQVISSFELNALASLTYHEAQVITSSKDMTEILMDHLEQIMKGPIHYSTISVHKSLVLARHILLHGPERIIQLIRQQLGRYVEQLTEYNTVLLEQQQQAQAWLIRIKGGSVDRGGPVRDAAQTLHSLLQSTDQQLQWERRLRADPSSLVPVGSKHQVAFATDEVRLHHLKQQMEEQQRTIVRSNLKKSSDGFGSGYSSKDGKSVVGAAHGIEEMIRMKEKEEKKFSDEKKSREQSQLSVGVFSEYQAPSLLEESVDGFMQQQHQETDLIGFDDSCLPNAPVSAVVDLLDLGDTVSTITQQSYSQQDLLFGKDTSASFSAGFHDPFQKDLAPVKIGNDVLDPTVGLLGLMSLNNSGNASHDSTPATSVHRKQTVMSSNNNDPFAALDALADGSNTKSGGPQLKFSGSNSFAELGLSSENVSGFLSTSQQYGVIGNQQPSATAFVLPSLSSIRVSSMAFATPINYDDSESGFVMGGSEGAGLEPLGQAPAAPPPAPPEGW